MNKHLLRAKINVNDEFFTQYEDIEKELFHYKQFLENKKIVCPCDQENSNFIIFLNNVKKEWKIKSINFYNKFENINYQNFDIVITNPPFSLSTNFINILLKNKIDFIIILPQTKLDRNLLGSMITNKKWFVGFNTPKKFINNNKLKEINTFWLSTFKLKENNFNFNFNNDLNFKTYDDQYGILMLSKIKEIPNNVNFSEIMAVPITILLNWENFDAYFNFLGTTEKYFKDIKINGKQPYKRVLIRRKEFLYEKSYD